VLQVRGDWSRRCAIVSEARAWRRAAVRPRGGRTPRAGRSSAGLHTLNEQIRCRGAVPAGRCRPRSTGQGRAAARRARRNRSSRAAVADRLLLTKQDIARREVDALRAAKTAPHPRRGLTVSPRSDRARASVRRRAHTIRRRRTADVPAWLQGRTAYEQHGAAPAHDHDHHITTCAWPMVTIMRLLTTTRTPIRT